MQVRRAERCPDDEKCQGDQHVDLSLAHGVKRAGPAAATELHADAEQECADHHRCADRCQRAADLDRGEQLAEQGKEQQRGEAKQQQLCAYAGAIAVTDKKPPATAKTKSGMQQGDTQSNTDQKGQVLRSGDGLLGIQADTQYGDTGQQYSELVAWLPGGDRFH